MSAMWVKIDLFDVPVCNSFQAKILNDQLCYEVDLNRFSNKENINRELELGFNFVMDYNEDRQIDLNQYQRNEMELGLASSMVELDHSQKAIIYLNTIGRKIWFKRTVGRVRLYVLSEPVKLIGEGQYNFDTLKDLRVTESYLEMARDIRECQNDEPFFNCTTRQYVDAIMERCECLPHINLKSNGKVDW